MSEREPSWKKWENFEPTEYVRGAYGEWHRKRMERDGVVPEKHNIQFGCGRFQGTPRKVKYKPSKAKSGGY